MRPCLANPLGTALRAEGAAHVYKFTPALHGGLLLFVRSLSFGRSTSPPAGAAPGVKGGSPSARSAVYFRGYQQGPHAPNRIFTHLQALPAGALFTSSRQRLGVEGPGGPRRAQRPFPKSTFKDTKWPPCARGICYLNSRALSILIQPLPKGVDAASVAIVHFQLPQENRTDMILNGSGRWIAEFCGPMSFVAVCRCLLLIQDLDFAWRELDETVGPRGSESFAGRGSKTVGPRKAGPRHPWPENSPECVPPRPEATHTPSSDRESPASARPAAWPQSRRTVTLLAAQVQHALRPT